MTVSVPDVISGLSASSSTWSLADFDSLLRKATAWSSGVGSECGGLVGPSSWLFTPSKRTERLRWGYLCWASSSLLVVVLSIRRILLTRGVITEGGGDAVR